MNVYNIEIKHLESQWSESEDTDSLNNKQDSVI